MRGTGKGWAVIEQDGSIDPRTVAHSRVGAIVNWLLARKRMIVGANVSDADIEQLLWHLHIGEAELVEVLITPLKGTTHERQRAQQDD